MLNLIGSLALLLAGSASLLLNLGTIFTMGIAILVGRDHLSRKGVAEAALILVKVWATAESETDAKTGK
jgi:drug/metabolite transporter (DMT)-like permease